MQADLLEALDAQQSREPYNGEPPHVAGSETSKEAAESVKPSWSYLQQKVLDHIRSKGEAGVTCDKIEEETGLSHQTCSARVRELYLKGSIIKTDRKRKTRSGRNAAVYCVRAAPTGEAA